MKDAHLTEKQLAQRLKLHQVTLARKRREGADIPKYLTVFGKILYPLKDVEAWERVRKKIAENA